MNSLSKIKTILSENFGIDDVQIIPSSDLSRDLNLSPIEISDLITHINKEFKLMVPEDTDLSHLNTIAEILNFIEVYGEEI